MTKQEVINALTRHMSKFVQCGDCPYFELPAGECKERLLEDAVRLLKDYDNALKLMVLQYCTDDNDYLWNRNMVAGETAFRVLGVKNGDRMEMDE